MASDTNIPSPPEFTTPLSPPLHPWQQALREGQALEFSRDDEPAARTVQADWLNELAAGFDRTVTVPVRISGAIIQGKLDLRCATFKNELTITDANFTGEVMLPYATFERPVNLQGTSFAAPLNLSGAHAKSDFCLTSASLNEPSTFDDMQTDGVFTAAGATFAEVTFCRSKFGSAARFDSNFAEGRKQPVRFLGAVSFEDAEIEGPAYFNSAQFGQAANFQRVRINNAAYFRCYAGTLMCAPSSPPASPISPASPVSPPSAERIIAARFEGPADFSFAYVNGLLSFEGAQFMQKADFVRLHVDSYIDFSSYYDEATGQYSPTVFGVSVSFKAAQTLGGAAFIGVEFEGPAGTQVADFESVNIGGHLLFQPLERKGGGKSVPVYFRGDVSFLAARVRNNAEFSGAQFEGEAEFGTLEVTRNLYFRPAEDNAGSYHFATFHGPARFLGAHIIGDAEFTSVRFNKEVIFESLHVEGITFFDNKLFKARGAPAVFGGLADFTSAHFHHRAEFSNAVFNSNVIFEGADFEGAGLFVHTKFGKKAVFTGAHFRQQAEFTKAEFTRKARFDSVLIDGAVLFRRATFKGKTSFRAAHFQSLDFNIKPLPQATQNFAGDIDLGGFTYDLIDINEEILDDIFRGLLKYNRQPYTQLERVLRSIGQDDLANRTYLEQRRRQRLDQKQRLQQGREDLWKRAQLRAGLWFDRAQKLVGNYGVQPTLRLLLISIGVLAIGMLMFTRYGAVELKEKEPADEALKVAAALQPGGTSPAGVPVTNAQQQATQAGSGPQASHAPSAKQSKVEDLVLTQALGVSFNQFIPIVEVPSGSKWKPSQKLITWPFTDRAISSYISYSLYGTFHKLLGAILVPLGVAALTGLLHRTGKDS